MLGCLYYLPLLPQWGQTKAKKDPCRVFIPTRGLLAVSDVWCCGDPDPGVAVCPLGASTPVQMQSSHWFCLSLPFWH